MQMFRTENQEQHMCFVIFKTKLCTPTIYFHAFL